MAGSVTLSDGIADLNLIVTKISYSLVPATDRVFGWQSSFTTVPTLNTSEIELTCEQPSIDAQNQTVGIIQRWANQQTVLSIQGEEVDIVNWAGVIKEAPYQWRYDQPEPEFKISIETSVDWVFDESSPDIGPVDLSKLYGEDGCVSETVKELESTAAPKEQQAAIKAVNHAIQKDLQSNPANIIPFIEGGSPQPWEAPMKAQEFAVSRNPDGTLNLEYRGQRYDKVTISRDNYRQIFSV